jgi:hypothetical protein
MKSDTVELFKWPSYPGQSWTPDAGPSCAPVDKPETTDEICERLVKWSDDEILGLDPNSGNVLQWWVAHP